MTGSLSAYRVGQSNSIILTSSLIFNFTSTITNAHNAYLPFAKRQQSQHSPCPPSLRALASWTTLSQRTKSLDISSQTRRMWSAIIVPTIPPAMDVQLRSITPSSGASVGDRGQRWPMVSVKIKSKFGFL
jgi:hypothetical protein